MEEKQAGITALVTAYARAYHATHDAQKIFDDFLADQLFSAEEHRQFDHNLEGLINLIDPDLAATQPDDAAALAYVMQRQNGPVTLSRSRYTEDCLETAVKRGVQQYVILGAGLDTFAFRRPDLVAQLQIFEVDHPSTQALKRERIQIAGWVIPQQLHFVPIDFAQEDLAAALAHTAYDANKLTFISWLGVTYYLSPQVACDVLKTIASLTCHGSTLVFDYMDSDAFEAGKVARRTQLMQRIAQMVGEPMKSSYDPQRLGDELGQMGYHLEENLSPVEIETRYFQGRTDGYHAFEHIHFARAVRSEPVHSS